MQSYFSRSCRPPSGSSCSLPLVSCRQRRIPGTQDSRPCRWFLSLAPKRHINSKFLPIFWMSNSRTLSTGSAHETSYLTTKTPLKTHDIPKLMGSHSCIAARRLFDWAALSVLLWAWQQICTSTLLFPGSTDVMLRYKCLLAPDSFSNFIFFYYFSDRPTENQKTHSTISKKKGGGLNCLE